MDPVRLTEVRERIAAAARRAGRDPSEITLVAVSKTADDAAVLDAYRAGQRDFGENRAGELAERAPRLPSDIRWHFIGRLQRNKARRVRPVTHLLHSLDRPRLVDAWAKGAGSPPPALVQVNVAGEEQKAGVTVDEAADLVDAATRMGIEVRGLMTMPPVVDDPETARPWFEALADLGARLRRDRPHLTELSMGMTDDFEVAVESGATLLRIGRAIFGPFPERRGSS
jgi:pyridoxal phosphate enzyme (YggS family)